MSYPPPGQFHQQQGWVPSPPPTYGGRGFGQSVPGLAPYGRRMAAFLIDQIVVFLLVGVAFVILVTGDTELVRCNIDSDGDIVLFETGSDTRQGICERPTSGTFMAAGFIGLAAVAAWFLYHAWEGASGKTLGKLMVGTRLVDEATLEPIGAWKGVGRGIVEGLLGGLTCGLGSFVDYLWPLWDDDNQTLHDMAVSAVVLDAQFMVPKGTAMASMGTTWNAPPAAAPGPTAYPSAPPPGYAPTWVPPSPPVAPPDGAGEPGSPTDPHGRPPVDPFA